MNFDEYQQAAEGTAVYPVLERLQGLTYTSLGLAGEAGEVANKVKKVIRDDNGKLTAEKADAIADEIGDVLWYAAMVATELGVSLDRIAADNLATLKSRKERGVIKGSGDNR